ncbi:thiamine diphosphokinase [Prevotella dentasini]|uniref:thiamine diphosphokinase n=1 Tax=Prevotella dentasini TaxID=589537 RepID=UPI000469A52F|nr:thiamine diphosphokinase [Prevotella dentasini]
MIPHNTEKETIHTQKTGSGQPVGASLLSEEKWEAVILAAGDFPNHPLSLRILRETKNLFVCDGALAGLLELGIEPAAVVGDGDSLSPELKRRYEPIYHQISEQEYNDLTKATLFARSHLSMNAPGHGVPRFCYLGATGKREDHTLGNISLMLYYYRQLGIMPTMITDYGWFVPASGDTRFKTVPGQQVSIFNASCRQLSSEGLKWEAYPFGEFWQGTLNEAVGNEFAIHGDGDYMVYRVFASPNDFPNTAG